jgi:hypothetical protein
LKKLACIALAILHLLGIAGGYWFFFGLQQIHKKELAARLDTGNYAGSQTITIKLPLDTPHESDNENYERVDGDLEFEGTVYRMIEQKFYKDTVYIVCYKDDRGIAIKGALHNYTRSLADPAADAGSSSKIPALFIKDYLVSPAKELTGICRGVVIDHFQPYQNNYKHTHCYAVDFPPEPIG